MGENQSWDLTSSLSYNVAISTFAPIQASNLDFQFENQTMMEASNWTLGNDTIAQDIAVNLQSDYQKALQEAAEIDAITKKIWLYVSPLILIFGTIGNFMVVFVMWRKPLRNSTTSLYLIALAFTDTFVLYTGLLRQWLRNLTGNDIRTDSNVACKLHSFCVYFGSQLSAWLLVVVTLERFWAVLLPHQSKIAFTRTRALISIGVIIFLLSTINLHWFFTKQIIEINGVPYCYLPNENLALFMYTIWPWIDFCLLSLLPFMILIICNASIIGRLLYSYHQTKKNKSGNDGSHSTKMTSMTAILLSVSFVFFFTTCPVAIYIILQDNLLQKIGDDPVQYAVMQEIWAIVNLIAYTNNAINFLLYCISGARFRRELIKIFHCGRVYPTDNSNNESTLGHTQQSTV